MELVSMELVSIEDVQRAVASLAGVAMRTPLVPCPWASRPPASRPPASRPAASRPPASRPAAGGGGEGLWLKPESLQPVGSFKLRGAYHAVACLPPEVRARGVVTHSSGNHGRAVAYAAKAFGVACVVVMPSIAPPVKIASVEALGAEVVLVEPADRATRTAEISAGRGMSAISSFDHRDVIAGQGTVGAEILADMPDVAVVIVPVGGGGLASGVATAIKAVKPGVAVYGVEPEFAAETRQSLREDRLVTWSTEQIYRTMADGVRIAPSALTFAHLRARLDGIVTVTEAQIAATVGLLAREANLVAEPSGALATAAYLHAGELPPGRTVAVVSGGNLDPALLADLVVRGPEG